MLRVPDGRLPAVHERKLEEYQSDVDRRCTYEKQVAEGKRLFKSRNSRKNNTFNAVRETLSEMCRGPRRCMYCEDAAADEVEHFRPKDLYPEAVFVWTNYLYACGLCNTRKNNRFFVIDPDTEEVVDATRAHKAPIDPPPDGNPALIDPRRENPLSFLMLDLRDTFEFTPTAEVGTLEYERAVRTIDVLELNARDYLVKARRVAFQSYRALLADYGRQIDPEYKLTRLNAIRESGYPSVWWEMKRQREYLEGLTELFAEAPELLEA